MSITGITFTFSEFSLVWEQRKKFTPMTQCVRKGTITSFQFKSEKDSFRSWVKALPRSSKQLPNSRSTIPQPNISSKSTDHSYFRIKKIKIPQRATVLLGQSPFKSQPGSRLCSSKFRKFQWKQRYWLTLQTYKKMICFSYSSIPEAFLICYFFKLPKCQSTNRKSIWTSFSTSRKSSISTLCRWESEKNQAQGK